jgi:hypothetical protein
MSGDKRSVATDALEVLGTVITDKKVGRDAVHLACLPVTVDDPYLTPGQHVGLTEHGKASAYAEKKVGIIDPFLPRVARYSEEVLLLLYPRTIESLRHVWSHPDVPDEPVAVAVPMPPIVARVPSTRADLIAELDRVGRQLEWPLTGNQMLDLMDGDPYHVVYGDDAYGSIDIPAELWGVFEKIHGKRAKNDPAIPGSDGLYFSCSC